MAKRKTFTPSLILQSLLNDVEYMKKLITGMIFYRGSKYTGLAKRLVNMDFMADLSSVIDTVDKDSDVYRWAVYLLRIIEILGSRRASTVPEVIMVDIDMKEEDKEICKELAQDNTIDYGEIFSNFLVIVNTYLVELAVMDITSWIANVTSSKDFNYTKYIKTLHRKLAGLKDVMISLETPKIVDNNNVQLIIAESLMDLIEDQKNIHRRKRRYIKTGFRSLDEHLLNGNGMERGRLYLIAGRPGQGKSAFVLNLAVNFARSNYNVLFITLENTMYETLLRLLALLLDKSIRDIEQDLMKFVMERPDTQVHEAIDEFLSVAGNGIIKEVLNYMQIVEFPAGTITVDEIERMIIKKEFNELKSDYDIIIVDYMDLVYEPIKKDERFRLSEITMKLKQLAQKLNAVLISPTQLNREAFKLVTADLNNLAESIAKAFHADTVLTLNSTKFEYDNNRIRIFAPKNRAGASNKQFVFSVDFSKMKFTDLEWEVDEKYLEEISAKQKQQKRNGKHIDVPSIDDVGFEDEWEF